MKGEKIPLHLTLFLSPHDKKEDILAEHSDLD